MSHKQADWKIYGTIVPISLGSLEDDGRSIKVCCRKLVSYSTENVKIPLYFWSKWLNHINAYLIQHGTSTQFIWCGSFVTTWSNGYLTSISKCSSVVNIRQHLQAFCGLTEFSNKQACDYSELTQFRNRIGTEDVELLFKLLWPRWTLPTLHRTWS